MNRIKALLMWICLMISICCLPLLTFKIQDLFVMGKTVEWNYQAEEYEIAREHPIISSLYSQFYSTDYNPLSPPEYNIKKELSLGKNIEKTKKLQTYFNDEINKILQAKVIPYSLIELEDNQRFKTNFGYIKDFTGEFRNTLYLTQYYRLHTDNDVDTTYEYDQFSKKIMSLTIKNKAINKLTDKELQTMCWNMISYLELDDIDDWYYSDYAYESKKAKLIVYCNTNIYGPFNNTLSIGISLSDNFNSYNEHSLITD